MIVMEDGAGKYCVEIHIILFRNLKAKLSMILFYILPVMANLMIVACQLYYLCGSYSTVCLMQTLQHDAVTFLVYEWMFAGLDPM